MTLFLQKRVYRYSFQLPIVVLALLVFNWSRVWEESPAIARTVCVKPVGRVYSTGDLYLRVGSEICSRDRINPAKGRTVTALCYLSGKFIHIKQKSIFDAPDVCAPLDTPQVCTGRNPRRCSNAKGPGDEQNKPTLISPYGSSMLSTKPTISWYAVPEATSYTVIVSGYKFYWETTVDKTITTLPYPKEQNQLQFGDTYKFTVLANNGDIPISYSETLTTSVLPQEEQDAIIQKVKQVHELALPPDEAAISDLDAIYMSRNLLNETIETLKARVAAGSQNPTVYRLLADRYLEAWLPKEALREYTKAAQIAKSTNNLNELDRIQEGLKIIDFWYNR